MQRSDPGHPYLSATEAPGNDAPLGRIEQDAATARTLISGALLGELGRRLYELENAIDWNTSCTSCARVLDAAAGQTFRAEAAEAKLATLAVHNRGHLELSGSCCPHLARENLAIIGIEEESGNG